MKKKITSLLVIVALALGTLALAGCSWFEANSISFVNAPATTYTIGEGQSELQFTIEVNGTEYKYSDYTDRITVSNFSTETAGTRTAYVRFDNKFQLSFTYTVLDGRYSGGTGTQTDPYLVSTPAQFQNLLNETTFKYYKITKTIDFSDVKLEMANDGRHCEAGAEWAGEIDGAGYSLLNLNTCLLPDGKVTNKYCDLFGRIASKEKGKFVLKNITVNYASSGDSALIGLAYGNGDGAEILFENVNFTGYMDASRCSDTGVSAGINIAGKTTDNFPSADFKSITFKNCTNSVKILNSFGVYSVSGYFGGNNGKFTGNVVFENCTFDGSIDGAGTWLGAFASQADNSKTPTPYNGQYVFTNCTIGANAKLVKAGTETVGEVSIKNYGTDVESITSTESLIATINHLEIIPNSDNKSFTVSVSDEIKSQITGYKVIVKGSLKQVDGGGDFRFLHPTELNKETGVFSLYKVVGSGDELTNTVDYGFASTRFVLDKTTNTATYYYNGVGTGITVNKVTVIVVAFNGDVAVAYGSLSGFDLSK